MPSIQLGSLFRYLSAGLVVLLLVSSGEALPKGKPGAACAVRAPGRSLHKRNLAHPSGKQAVTLFHGTSSSASAASIKAHGVDLAKTNHCGDLHHTAKGADGGAYFTDSVIAAAQYACHRDAYAKSPTPTNAYVLEFQWVPGSSKVFEFSSLKELTDDKCRDNAMITGPMHNPMTDTGLTTDFWQYAIVKQDALHGLHYVATHVIPCHGTSGENVPLGNKLTSATYADGQAGHGGYQSFVSTLVGGHFCPA